jgi:hypothetical protein
MARSMVSEYLFWAFAAQPAPSFEPAPIYADLTLRLYRGLLAESWLNSWELHVKDCLLDWRNNPEPRR